MAYTRPWSQVLNLLGSRDADEIDDASREAHTDLTERFSDILEDVNADPWKIKGVAFTQRFHWSTGYLGTPTSGAIGIGNFVNPNASGASMTVYMPIQVPIGMKLVEVKFRWKLTGAGASAHADVQKNLSSASVSIIANANASGTSWTDFSTGTLSEACSAGESFFATVSLTNGTGTFAEFMDMEVTVGPA